MYQDPEKNCMCLTQMCVHWYIPTVVPIMDENGMRATTLYTKVYLQQQQQQQKQMHRDWKSFQMRYLIVPVV